MGEMGAESVYLPLFDSVPLYLEETLQGPVTGASVWSPGENLCRPLTFGSSLCPHNKDLYGTLTFTRVRTLVDSLGCRTRPSWKDRGWWVEVRFKISCNEFSAKTREGGKELKRLGGETWYQESRCRRRPTPR